jgi:hypothetical protein
VKEKFLEINIKAFELGRAKGQAFAKP